MTQDRQSKEQQLSALKKQIALVEAQLREHDRQERKSKKNLGAFNRRTAELKRLIASLYARVDEISQQKEEVDASIVQTRSDIDSLKHAYAASVRHFYLHGGTHPVLASLSASAAVSVDAIEEPARKKRNEYYSHVIGEAHSLDRAKLDSVKGVLSASSTSLSATLNQQRSLITQHAQEQTSIEEQRKAEEQRLAQIQESRARLRQELARRKASARKLESIISNLVAKEEASRSARNRSATGKKHRKKPIAEPETPENADLTGAAHPHSLQWPTSSHHLKQGYGEHRNEELNTVTVNLGIDIAAEEGSKVAAAADGIVSLVSTLPGYGTIVVLRHAGNLHTVYADLGGATVSRGAHVTAGERIGESGSNEELGPSMHFEVWKGRVKQNPIGWLK